MSYILEITDISDKERSSSKGQRIPSKYDSNCVALNEK